MLNDPRFTAEVELTIPFHDVDMMGVVWHGNYFRYFEIAREALLNQFNYGYRQMKASGYLWPVVDTRVKYRDVITFEQRIRVRARLEEFENRLRIGYEIFAAESGNAPPPATPSSRGGRKSGEMCFVSPQVLFERMGSRHEIAAVGGTVHQSAGQRADAR